MDDLKDKSNQFKPFKVSRRILPKKNRATRWAGALFSCYL